MIKWILGLFGVGKIQSVESIMAPLIKTRNKLVVARDKRNATINKNLKAVEALKQSNIAHAAQASMASNMIDGLGEQLKPLDSLRNKG